MESITDKEKWELMKGARDAWYQRWLAVSEHRDCLALRVLQLETILKEKIQDARTAHVSN